MIRSPTIRLASLLVLSVLLATAVNGEDWPQWRGPNRDGVSSEAAGLESLPAGDLTGRWSVPVGVGFASPVVAQGRVFVADSELVRPKPHERVHAFEAATGKPLWSYTYDVAYPDWAFDEPNQIGPIATPIVQDGKLYTLGWLGHLVCFNAGKGDVLWKNDLAKEYPAKEFKCHASPLIEGDLLILFVGGVPGATVMALDKNSGREVWKALDEGVTSSSPIVVTASGKRQLIVWTQESVTSLDPATGNTYWSQRLLTSADYVVSTPVCQKDQLLVGGLMLKLDPEKPAATVLWPQSRAAARRILSHTSTAMFRGDHIFSAKSSGELVCLDAQSGEQLWETDKVTDLKNGASVHLTKSGERAWLFNERGELIRARLDQQGYHELGRVTLLAPTYPYSGRRCAWSPPAFANGRVFARSDKELVSATLAAKEP